MEITTTRSSRIDALKSSSPSFAKALRWSDANPIEERLALTSVARSGFFLLAPSVIIASAIVTWLLFPAESGTDSAGFFYGTLAIVFMAWALLLATRSRILEWSFGGFDRLHVWHRWAGTAAIVFLFLHTSSENNTRNGQTPFGVGVEEAGLVFASPAQVVLVTLVIISILRLLPYRIWRFSHLAIFVPFLFSAYHALTAERPLQEYELTGYWLWFWSIVGVASFVYRVLVVDSGALDKRAVVTSVLVGQKNVRLTLSRAQGWPRVKPGQFFYVRIGGTWREAHPFSIVQNDQNPLHVSVEMRKTGDWTDSVAARAVVGDTALVSRSYGHFRLQGTSSSTVWVAGGSGITPFLQSEATFRAFSASPTLVYFYRSESDAMGLDHLREMSDKGLLVLREVETGGSSARNTEPLTSALTPGSHVAVCGPRQLVVKVLTVSRKAKTGAVSFEIFDYRSPFGPDLNPLLKSLVRFILPRALFLKLGWLFEKDVLSVARS